MAGVTIYPSNEEPRTLDPSPKSLAKGKHESNFLTGIDYQKKYGPVLQSSFHDIPEFLFPDSNGFVHAAMNAYNQHYHLKIRPEDIWLAILTQLSSYINGHAEELRGSFVAFEGKKELVIDYDLPSRHSVPWDHFASTMTHLLHQNVVDPELREWIMPAFSTTTEKDKIIASIVMMASLQKYFDFTCRVSCGIPSVTLLGEKSDYELILERLEKLRSYGEQPTEFANLLTGILKRFIRSFDDPKASDVLDFWNRVVTAWHMGSGMDYYSGWITAFMFWDEDGKPLNTNSRYVNKKIQQLVLDGNTYPVVDMGDVPRGYSTVPVKIDDQGHELTAEMLAGSVGCHWMSSDKEVDGGGATKLDTIQPWSGWWIYETSQDDSQASYY